MSAGFRSPGGHQAVLNRAAPTPAGHREFVSKCTREAVCAAAGVCLPAGSGGSEPLVAQQQALHLSQVQSAQPLV